MLEFLTTYFYYGILRPMFKWLMRFITGQCQLLRITIGERRLGPRAFKIESSLKHSKHDDLKHAVCGSTNINTDEAVDKIVKAKSIQVDCYPEFPIRLKVCLSQIVGYRCLVKEVENLRKAPYSSEKHEHEDMLMKLWKDLKPETSLTSRVSRQWGDIGFQGDDPATDFRGMGLLGLSNLVFFTTRHNAVARKLLSHSTHPQFGYSFAIVGINLTSVVYQFLCSGQLKSHFYNTVPGTPSINDFHTVYVHIFFEFDKFWFAEKPKDIMQFNIVKEKFCKLITERLIASTTSQLQLDFNTKRSLTDAIAH